MRRLMSALVAVLVLSAPLAVRADHGGQWPEGFPATGAAPIITVLSTGSEPRIPMTYKVPAGTMTKTEMTTAMAMRISMAGMEMPEMPMPGMKMLLELAVDAVAPNGDMTVRTTVKPSVDLSGVPAEMASALSGTDMSAMTITANGIVTPSGTWRELKLGGSAAETPQFKQAMEQAQTSMNQTLAALPNVALGVGAKWEVKSRQATQGFEAFQTVVNEIVKIEGRTITFKVTTTMTAPAQEMKNPLLPPDAQISLTRMSGKGSGTLVADLDRLTNDGSLDMKMDMDVTMNMQGMSQAMAMAMSVKTAMKSVK